MQHRTGDDDDFLILYRPFTRQHFQLAPGALVECRMLRRNIAVQIGFAEGFFAPLKIGGRREVPSVITTHPVISGVGSRYFQQRIGSEVVAACEIAEQDVFGQYMHHIVGLSVLWVVADGDSAVFQHHLALNGSSDSHRVNQFLDAA